MKKIILAIIITSIFSCSKDDVVQKNESIENKIFIDKIIEYYISDGVEKEGLVTYYTYQNNYVSKTETKSSIDTYTYNEVREFNYVNGKLFSNTVVLNDYSGKQEASETFYYTSGLITSGTNNDFSGVFKNTYSYNEDKNLFIRKEFFDYGGLNTEYKYEYYSNGNLKNEYTTRISGVYEREPDMFEYDEKENPFYKIYPIEYCKIRKISKNNLIKSDFYTYEYEYNDKNYPIRRITKELDKIKKIEVFQYK